MLLALYEAGKLPLRRLVSARYPLDGVNEAFAAMHGGEVARAVLQLEEVGRGGR
jgi:S-(hydroxymethyl)mycothiol dehydrogenase